MPVHSCVVRNAMILLAVGAAASSALAGPDWVERGDAGNTLQSAQVPRSRSGGTDLTLTTISGVLFGSEEEPLRSGGDFEDVYLIRIDNVSLFNVTLINADFNPQFYLFNITLGNLAYGLLANDDDPMGGNLPRLTPMATDGTGAQILAPGDYLLAITGFGRSPFSITGAMFNQASPTEISGADGPGGFNPLDHWSGDGEFGNYNFRLEGTEFPETPAPASAALVVLGGLVAARRRR